MKKYLIALLVPMLWLAACAPPAGQGAGGVLLVTAGEFQKSFSVEALQALPAAEESFNGVAYRGVAVADLLDAAGVDPGAVKAFKAVAADGYAVNYDPAQFLKENVLVAYALADGSPMSAEDGDFRMVLPDEEGKLNVRMLTELQIIQ